MDSKSKGYLFVVLSAIIFGSMPLMAKYIYSGGGNAFSLVFFRSFFALPLLYIIAKRTDNNMLIQKNELIKIIILVLGGSALTPILLYNSYNFIPSGAATTIHFAYPIFVILGCFIFFKEKISFVKKLCVTICTFGMLLIADLKSIDNIVGVTLAFTSGIAFAFYIIFLERSGLKSIPQFKLGFYMATITSIAVFLYSTSTHTFTLSMTPKAWILSAIFANMVTVGAVVLFQLGIKYVGSQKASILSTFEPLTSLILGILFLEEIIDLKKIIAIILILTSGVLLSKFD